MLLGDGSIHNDKKILWIEQAQIRRPYVEWLDAVFANVAGTIGEPERQRKDVPNASTTFSCRFATCKAFACTEVVDSLFYEVRNGKQTKRVPKNIANLLTPTALAVWYMDD